jgi:hypothetical protein
MTQEQNAKYKRLNDRLNELSQLNGNIGRLAFYINENYMTDAMCCTLAEQREAMIKYRDVLQNRIINGAY